MVCWYKFSKAKSYFNNNWMAMVKNGCDILLGHETLKSAASQEWIDVKSWFLHADTNLGRLKITLTIIGWA